MPQCPYYPGVRIKRAFRENVRNTCFIDTKTKADSFTNQGSVEVCGKAVNRGGGLGMEIPCVYIFDGPRKHMDLLEQYQTFVTTQQYERRMILAVQLAASKQRQRGRRLRTVTETKSQGNETCVTGGRKLYVVQESNTERKIKICHAALLLFFVQYCNKILFTRKNLSLTVVRIKMVNFRKNI